MPFWSGETLREWIPRYNMIKPFDPDQIDWRFIPLSQVDQYLGLAGQIQNVAGFEFFGS
jgi:hypothetical protein